METGKLKLALSAGALALSMALAGCGGGGSSTAGMRGGDTGSGTGSDTGTTNLTPVAVTLPELPMAAEYAFALAVGQHRITAGQSLAAGGVMLECVAGGENCVVTVAAGGGITATGGQVRPTLTTAAAEALEEEKMATAQTMTQRAIGQAAALASGGNGTPPTFTTTHFAGKGASISGASGFTATDEQPGMLGKFVGIARVNTDSTAATQHLVVYTDRAAPKKAEFFDFDGDPETKPVYTAVSGTAHISLVDTGENSSAGSYKISGSDIDPSIFPQKSETKAGGSTPKVFAENAKDDPTDSANNRVRLPGTFDGATGIYQCTPGTVGDGCTVTVDATGVYDIDGTDAWIFTPNEGQKAYREDSEFLTFGWWMREPTKATGTYSFATYYGRGGTNYAVAGTPGASDTTGDGVRGKATYTGNAAGRYVVDGSFGAFTADATLTANFDDPDVEATDVVSIYGMINGFKGDATGMSDWSVELKKIAHTSAATVFDSSETDSSETDYDGTVAKIGDVTAHGTWEGRFFGNQKDPADLDGNKANTANAAPLAVGGEFHADGAGVNIAGAFGARR